MDDTTKLINKLNGHEPIPVYNSTIDNTLLGDTTIDDTTIDNLQSDNTPIPPRYDIICYWGYTNYVIPPKEEGYVRIACLGDTYGNTDQIYPVLNNTNVEIDIIVHCGNFVTNDRLFKKNSIILFMDWIKKTKAMYRIVIGGTNDGLLAKTMLVHDSNMISQPAIHQTQNTQHQIQQQSFYMFLNGTTLLNNLRICTATRVDKFGKISFVPFDAKCSIIISHIPPFGILDIDANGNHIGSHELLDNLTNYPPLVCIFSGCPESYGKETLNNMLYINCGLFDKTGKNTGQPIIFDCSAGAVGRSTC